MPPIFSLAPEAASWSSRPCKLRQVRYLVYTCLFSPPSAVVCYGGRATEDGCTLDLPIPAHSAFRTPPSALVRRCRCRKVTPWVRCRFCRQPSKRPAISSAPHPGTNFPDEPYLAARPSGSGSCERVRRALRDPHCPSAAAAKEEAETPNNTLDATAETSLYSHPN